MLDKFSSNLKIYSRIFYNEITMRGDAHFRKNEKSNNRNDFADEANTEKKNY